MRANRFLKIVKYFFISEAVFIGLVVIWEIAVYLWGVTTGIKGPIIRADIWIFYPMFFIISLILLFWLVKKNK